MLLCNSPTLNLGNETGFLTLQSSSTRVENFGGSIAEQNDGPSVLEVGLVVRSSEKLPFA